MPLAVGEVFAGYNIVRVLGAGAMGTVYLVQHPRLPRHDALKVLSAALTADPQYRARFLREADIAAGLSHPNILGIHDRGESGEQFWISMDFVSGTDAAKLLREHYPRGMPVGLAMQIITAVGSALDYAHQRGLLHREVKPANILIADPGSEAQRVFLADFGIARRVDDTGLTATNIAIGTVAYAAPEQLMGETIDARADQYALACTAFHLLTGAQPYDHSSAAVVITKHVMAPPPPIGERRPELAALQPVFDRALAKRPAERFMRCQDFTQALHRSLNPGATLVAPDPGRAGDTMLAPTPIDMQSTQFAPIPPPIPPPVPSPPPQWVPSPMVGTVPPGPAGPGSQPNPKGRRVALAAIAALAVVIGVVVVIALTNTGSSTHPAVSPTSTPPPNSGPFTGTFIAEFGPLLNVLGQEQPNTAAPGKETWNLRSACGAGLCVATASKASGPFTAHPPNLVFDDVAGRWTAVAVAPGPCHGHDTETWNFVWLQPRPDGAMAGEWVSDAVDCYSKRVVTFTRTGDTNVASLADPLAQPARVVSAAQGLHGQYHSHTTMPGARAVDENFNVQTICLRAGDRCISRFENFEGTGALLLVYTSGVWARNDVGDVPCPDGRTSHRTIDGVFPAPNPPQDPIMELTGHGHKQEAGSSCISGDYTQVLNRTGD